VSPDLSAVAAPPTASFEALPDNNTVIPPDTHGAAGPAHLMTTLNSQVRIQNKSGGIISTNSLDGFWSVLTGDPFDPRVHYDALSGRWIAICVANSETDSSEVYFAISDNSDPTAAWTFYAIDADPAAGGPWADYPTVGFNEKWIAITANMFTPAGSFDGPKMWVIDLHAPALHLLQHHRRPLSCRHSALLCELRHDVSSPSLPDHGNRSLPLLVGRSGVRFWHERTSQGAEQLQLRADRRAAAGLGDSDRDQ
jgi:hypothetical protein